jgi:peptidoglycan hydrolase-like protein with peptidoglycan-binding domain
MAVAIVAVLAVVAAAVGWFMAGRRGSAAEEPRYTTSTARRGTLADTVEADFTLKRVDSTTLASPASGTLTKVRIEQGTKLGVFTPLFDVDGVTVRGIPSSAPLYRDLSPGDEGDDVKALQQALKDAGYDPGDVDGDFGDATVTALEDWQDDRGLDVTGTFTLAGFAWYAPGSTVLDVAVEAGAKAGPGTTVATIGRPSALMAEADVSQLDVNSLKVGQTAALSLDADDSATIPAKVSSVAADAESSDAEAGSNTVVQFAVELTPAELPATARAGMTGSATVTIRSRTDVVIVPTVAVGGNAGSPSVQVLDNGTPVTRPVVTGLATADSTEIITGLRAGEVVVTGTVSADDTSQQGSNGGRGNFPAGGGFAPGGGSGGPPVIRNDGGNGGGGNSGSSKP